MSKRAEEMLLELVPIFLNLLESIVCVNLEHAEFHFDGTVYCFKGVESSEKKKEINVER